MGYLLVAPRLVELPVGPDFWKVAALANISPSKLCKYRLALLINHNLNVSVIFTLVATVSKVIFTCGKRLWITISGSYKRQIDSLMNSNNYLTLKVDRHMCNSEIQPIPIPIVSGPDLLGLPFKREVWEEHGLPEAQLWRDAILVT